MESNATYTRSKVLKRVGIGAAAAWSVPFLASSASRRVVGQPLADRPSVGRVKALFRQAFRLSRLRFDAGRAMSSSVERVTGRRRARWIALAAVAAGLAALAAAAVASVASVPL